MSENGRYDFLVFFFFLVSFLICTVRFFNCCHCMVKIIPPVNFCSDENIQIIFGTKLEDL
jgi:hypothetical protein